MNVVIVGSIIRIRSWLIEELEEHGFAPCVINYIIETPDTDDFEAGLRHLLESQVDVGVLKEWEPVRICA